MDSGLIQKLNATDWQIYIAITGGGQTFIGEYLRQSGGSKVIIGANVPYRQSAFDSFVKVKVDNYSSDEAARKLAVAAYNTSLQYGADKQHAVGLGAASSLAKDDERQGRQHKINVAVHTSKHTASISFTLNQGRTRSQEEDLTANIILNFLVQELVGFTNPKPMPLYEGEFFTYDMANDVRHIELINDERLAVQNNLPPSNRLVVYPGSWNPFHDGHGEVVELAEQVLGDKVALELSVHNADKGQMDFIEIRRRSDKLDSRPHILTKASTFVEKAKLFHTLAAGRQIVFVVGADTWERIWQPKYGYSPQQVADTMQQHNVKFLVFPREGHHISNNFDYLRIQDARINAFSNSLSSTALRKK